MTVVSTALVRTVAVAAALVLASTTVEARADERVAEPPASCDAAFEAAELRLRPSEGRLLDARAALRACALPKCKPWMVDDCTKRLAEVEGRIPSVAFSAEDARGASLRDVRVLEGERELLERLDGRAIEMDPGPHDLVAERAGVRVALSVVVIEGKKAQQVVFAFPDATLANPAAIAPPAREPPLAHPWARPLAGATLATAVVATGIGIGFSAVTLAKKSDARCDAQNFCDGEPLESARDAARAATVSFVAAGTLAVASAVTFFVFGHTRVNAMASPNHVQIAATW